MSKKITFIIFIATLISVNCFSQAPAISYNTPNIYTKGSVITNLSPAITGGTITSYTISPALPAGLALAGTTGVITGVPTTATPAAKYTVTANSAAGSSKFDITITVTDPVPPAITYPSPNTFNVNTTIPPVSPTVIGSPVTSYSVNPALPAGLALDAATGIITGTPTNVTNAADYTVTATSGALSGQFKINIAINDPSIPKIVYSTPNVFTYNIAIPTLSPSVTGGTANNYAITPSLTPGLAIDAATGVITGVPATTSGTINYVVSATTPAGKRYANVQIRVDPNLPANLYSPSVAYFSIDTLITPMKPVNGDIVHSIYSIAPDLPDGLRLNSVTGEITGTPTKAYLAKNYTVKATNISGQATEYTVNITIVPRLDKVSKPATITFVGQGNIQQSLNSNAAIAANTGIGVIFRENSSKKYGILHDIEIDFFVNIASTVDTIKSVNNAKNMVTNKQDFGNSVLLPLNSGQAFSFSLKGYFTDRGGVNGNYRRNEAPKSLLGVLSGFNVSLAGSNRNWEFDDYDKTVAPIAVKTSLLSFYAGTFFEFITPTKENNYGQNASITLGAGYTGRWILGDVQQSAQSAFRKQLLGSTANSFNGAEITLGLRFYNIKAEVHLPFFSSKEGIAGLSGSHLTTFIGFSGGFPIDLAKTTTQ